MSFQLKLVGLFALLVLLIPSIQASSFSGQDGHQKTAKQQQQDLNCSAGLSHYGDSTINHYNGKAIVRCNSIILQGTKSEVLRPKIPSERSAFTLLPRKPPTCVYKILPLKEIDPRTESTGQSAIFSGSFGNTKSTAVIYSHFESPVGVSMVESDNEKYDSNSDN